MLMLKSTKMEIICYSEYIGLSVFTHWNWHLVALKMYKHKRDVVHLEFKGTRHLIITQSIFIELTILSQSHITAIKKSFETNKF